jgi:hypothetical protein
MDNTKQTLQELYDKAFEAGRKSILDEMTEEQKKLLQGFAYKTPHTEGN